MTRLSRIPTLADAELEAKRQDLKDQRWARWRSMGFFALFAVGVLTGEIPLQELGEALRALAEPDP